MPNCPKSKYQTQTTDFVFILAEINTEATCICGDESAELSKHGYTRIIKLHDSPRHHKFTEIYFRIKRFLCSSCGKTLQHEVSGRFGMRHLTNRLCEYIEWQSLNMNKSFTDLSLETGVGECVIRSIFTEHGKNLESNRKIVTPRFISIDENYVSNKKSIRCVITSPEDRSVLEILKDNNRTTIERWLRQLPDRDKIEVVTMDMSPTYLCIIQEILPKAEIVIDRYHVQNLLNVELKSVIAVISSTLSATQQREDMKRWSYLLKSRHRLTEVPKRQGMKVLPAEKNIVKDWLVKFPLLGRAYNLKEGFSDVLQLNDRSVAEIRADDWLKELREFVKDFDNHYKKECKRLDKNPFKATLHTFTRLMKFILNYVDYKSRFKVKATSGFAEYANRRIKQAHARGNGYNYEVLRIKILYSGILRKEMPLHPLSDIEFSKKVKKHKTKGLKINKKNGNNPNSIINLLKDARESHDQMLKISESFEDIPGFSERFEIQSRLTFENETEYIESDENIKNPDLLIYNIDRNKFYDKKLTKKQIQPKKDEQLPLFEFFNEKDKAA